MSRNQDHVPQIAKISRSQKLRRAFSQRSRLSACLIAQSVNQFPHHSRSALVMNVLNRPENTIPSAKSTSAVPTTFHFLNIKPPSRNMLTYSTMLAARSQKPLAGMMKSDVPISLLILNDISESPQDLSSRQTKASLRK